MNPNLAFAVFSQPSAPGLGYLLYQNNLRTYGIHLYAWSLLSYAAEFNLTRAEVLDNFTDVLTAIREMPEEWLIARNIATILVPEYSQQPKTREVLQHDWHAAWESVGTPKFRYPKVKQPEL